MSHYRYPHSRLGDLKPDEEPTDAHELTPEEENQRIEDLRSAEGGMRSPVREGLAYTLTDLDGCRTEW